MWSAAPARTTLRSKNDTPARASLPSRAAPFATALHSARRCLRPVRCSWAMTAIALNAATSTPSAIAACPSGWRPNFWKWWPPAFPARAARHSRFRDCRRMTDYCRSSPPPKRRATMTTPARWRNWHWALRAPFPGCSTRAKAVRPRRVRATSGGLAPRYATSRSGSTSRYRSQNWPASPR